MFNFEDLYTITCEEYYKEADCLTAEERAALMGETVEG